MSLSEECPIASLRRPRVNAMLTGNAEMRVRILCCPVGGGATTALQDYARSRPDVVYLAPPPGAGSSDIAIMLRDSGAAHDIVVDGADRISQDAFDALLQYAAASGGPRLLLAGHTRKQLRVHTLVPRGAAELLDATQLAFTTNDLFRMARLLEMDASDADIEDIVSKTDGWPMAVSWIVRDAASRRRPLSGAFESWIRGNAHLLLEFLEESLGHLGDGPLFEYVLSSTSYAGMQTELSRLESDGYPIARTRSGLRPYRLMRHAVQPTHAAENPKPQLSLTLFGSFACRVGSNDVAFVRRRDRSVLIYLALAPGARVSRSQLAEVFWPDAPPALSSQGVRTTLSRLRRAIAAATGGSAGAEHYLRCGSEIALDRRTVVVDAHRFEQFLERGRVAEDRGEIDQARRHYLLAKRLRAERELLRSEPLEPVLEPLLQRFAHLGADVEQRLTALDEGGEASDNRRTRAERDLPRAPGVVVLNTATA